MSHKLGIVAIGRNEGERLVACLRSAQPENYAVVYVDSGSSDDSCSKARELGAAVVNLDLSIPFTAARARNAGWQYLLAQQPELEFIHFIDGDCEFVDSWLETALQYLQTSPDYAVVCGQRKERYPSQTVYNHLCDIEWNTPVGDANACGGDALFRVAALKQVQGYREDLIAGEEPELCYRLRCEGWKIYRYDAHMTLHDAAMFSSQQWWKRMQRAGYAYAEGYAIHGGTRAKLENYRWPDVRRILLWTVILPTLILTLSLFSGYFLILFLIYPLQLLRLTAGYKKTLATPSLAFPYALSNLIGKFAQFGGVLKYTVNRMKGRRGTLIEYK